MNTALLIIDIQNDYFPGGAMELVGSDAAAERAAQVLEAFRSKNVPVVHANTTRTHSAKRRCSNTCAEETSVAWSSRG